MEKNNFKIAVIPGDGIGPEVMDTMIEILRAFNLPFKYEEFEAGKKKFLETGASISDGDLEKLKKFDAILLGAIGTPSEKYSNYKSAVLRIRKGLNLYANIRPIINKQKGVNIYIFRENTEDLYCQEESFIEHQKKAVAKKIITRAATEAIVKCAIAFFLKNKRSKITIVHKANVLKISDGFFRDVCKEALLNENIPFVEEYIDAMAYKLIKFPTTHDVIVTSNLYGDILSDLGGVLVDNIGMLPSINLGNFCNLYEPVHGSAPDIAGKDIANPYGMVLCGSYMLRDLGFAKEAEKIEGIVEKFIEEGITAISVGGMYKNSQIRDMFVEISKQKECH